MKVLIPILLLSISSTIFAQQGWWSAKLQRKDGSAIPFTFEWKTEKGKPVWYIHNAAEKIKVDNIKKLKELAEQNEINFYYYENAVGISVDETTTQNGILDILYLFASIKVEQTNTLRRCQNRACCQKRLLLSIHAEDGAYS